MIMEDTHRFQLRIARDRLMDQVIYPFCSDYPIRDLVVTPQNPVVLYNNKARLTVAPVQDNVEYVLYDETGEEMSSAMKRSDGQLIIDTKNLTREDYTFSIIATKTETGLYRQLLQTVTIKVGVDVEIPVSVIPVAPEYNMPVTIQLEEAQSGAIYQVFDQKDNALSEPINSKSGGDVAIPVVPLKEDTQIKIKVTNIKTKQTGFLLNPPLIRVYPDTKVVAAINAQTGIDFNAVAEILLTGTQDSADYQLIFKDIDDDTADKVNLLNTPVGKSAKGKGDKGAVSLKTTKLSEDLTVAVLVTKSDSKLQRELETNLFIKVKPDPTKELIVYEKLTAPGDTATLEVLHPQRGIYYQLRNNANNQEVGWRRYYHKNYGIGKARIGVEFAVDPIADDTVFLATGPLQGETTFNVMAVKATTGESTQLNQILTVKIE